MKRNEQPRAEQILTETDATRSTPGFRNIISEFARVNDSIVIEPSEDDSVGFQETDNPNFPDRPAYRLSLPSTLTVAHVIEAITHIESVSDKLPVTITSIQTARMMIASGDYIREHVLPITKDPQGFSEIADSMEEYGEKMKAETPKEFQAEFEKPPSDEEMFTWLLGKEAYTRLYSSYHRIHKIDPNNAMHHDEFTDYLQRRFGEILTQYPSERTTHGLEQAALSREKDVMSALHKRGKRELVTKLFARTSQERRDDLTKKKADNKPLSITEKWELMLLNAASDEKLQKKLVESIKERVGFDEAMADLTALRENQKEHGKNLTMIKQKENELITKLYDQVSLFPHEEESATPRTGLIRRTLNCFAKTQLLTELIQDTNIPVYLASIPGHVFCVVEFSDGTPCTFDANGFGIEPESPGYPNFFLTQQLGTDKHPTALNSVHIPPDPALLKRYRQIFPENDRTIKNITPKIPLDNDQSEKQKNKEPIKPPLGKVCRVDEATKLLLINHGLHAITITDEHDALFAKEVLAYDPTNKYIREELVHFYLFKKNLDQAERLLTEDLRLKSFSDETKHLLWEDWQDAMFVEKRYAEVFDTFKRSRFETYSRRIPSMINFPRPYGRGINLFQTKFALNLFYLAPLCIF